MGEHDQPALSVIVPTIGRASLRSTLVSIYLQLSPQDEVIVVGDGPQPAAKAMIGEAFDDRTRYFETPPTRRYGNAQRDFGISKAKNPYLLFMDDDDTFLLNSFRSILAVIAEYPGRPLLFRMHHHERIIWEQPELKFGNVSTQMFVTPNDPARLGKWDQSWDDGQGCDFLFIRDTVGLYPEGSLVWRSEVIAELKEHRRGQ